MNLVTQIQKVGIKQIVTQIRKDPDKNILKLLDKAEKWDIEKRYTPKIRGIRVYFEEPENN